MLRQIWRSRSGRRYSSRWIRPPGTFDGSFSGSRSGSLHGKPTARGKRSVHDGDGHKNAFCRARIIGRSQNPGVRRCWVRQTMGEERSPVQGIARNNDHESCQSGLLSPDYLTAFRPSEFPSQHLLTPGFWLLAPFLKPAEARPREIPACHQRRIRLKTCIFICNEMRNGNRSLG